jgi:hypothetical protein
VLQVGMTSMGIPTAQSRLCIADPASVAFA